MNEKVYPVSDLFDAVLFVPMLEFCVIRFVLFVSLSEESVMDEVLHSAGETSRIESNIDFDSFRYCVNHIC